MSEPGDMAIVAFLLWCLARARGEDARLHWERCYPELVQAKREFEEYRATHKLH